MEKPLNEIIVDPFLHNDADCPVFGFNLACAYPFPPPAAKLYQEIAHRLAKLDPAVYIYPEWGTHVTIITFVNFNLHRRPVAKVRAELESMIGPVIEIVRPTVAGRPFSLVLDTPILTPKAAYLPISAPSGEIARIRREVVAALEKRPDLHKKLCDAGLNVPGIVHSTIMRFKAVPTDLKRFATDFAKICAVVRPIEIQIDELLLTTETKPYMREGAVLERFPLARG